LMLSCLWEELRKTEFMPIGICEEGSGQIRAKIYAKALLMLLQRDRRKIRRVFHIELT
jgi:hypothetical protein